LIGAVKGAPRSFGGQLAIFRRHASILTLTYDPRFQGPPQQLPALNSGSSTGKQVHRIIRGTSDQANNKLASVERIDLLRVSNNRVCPGSGRPTTLRTAPTPVQSAARQGVEKTFGRRSPRVARYHRASPLPHVDPDDYVLRHVGFHRLVLQNKALHVSWGLGDAANELALP